MALDSRDRRRLAVEFCGMPFNTPLVLLSGCVGFGEEYTRVEGFSNRDAGADLSQGNHARAEARQRAPPGVGDAGGDAQLHRAAESRLSRGDRRDPADARLQRDTVLRESLGDRPSRSTPISHGGSTTPPSTRWRSTYRARTFAKAVILFGNDPGNVAPRRRRMPGRDRQAAGHQALAEPDRHRGERAPLHRGRHRRARGGEHLRRHGHRPEDPTPGARREQGRAVRAGGQAHGPVPGASGPPGGPQARRPDHRPGRNCIGGGCAGVHDRGGQPRSVWAPRCSTIPWCACASTKDSRDTRANTISTASRASSALWSSTGTRIPGSRRAAGSVAAAGRRFAMLHSDPDARSRRRRNTPISFAAWRSPLAVAEAIPRRQASAAA